MNCKCNTSKPRVPERCHAWHRFGTRERHQCDAGLQCQVARPPLSHWRRPAPGSRFPHPHPPHSPPHSYRPAKSAPAPLLTPRRLSSLQPALYSFAVLVPCGSRLFPSMFSLKMKPWFLGSRMPLYRCPARQSPRPAPGPWSVHPKSQTGHAKRSSQHRALDLPTQASPPEPFIVLS